MRELKRERNNVEEEEEVWVTHYSSNHQILLVGEGDFSFSSSLATSFTSASNICASSLDSYDDVVRKYKRARSNLETLRKLGAFLLHGVDATKLQLYPDLNRRRFDRIIFNFPHAGFHGKESDPHLIQKHRKLLFGFFQGASRMLSADGEIHVSHKNKAPFCHWKLQELANRCSLVLKQCVAFEKSKYPGYENKRGDGSRCDIPFILGDCSTFKFISSRITKRAKRESESAQAFSSESVSQQRPVSYDHQDHNNRLVQDSLLQSRQRTSLFGLLHYYREHSNCSQFGDARPVALERDHGLFVRSNSQFHDFPFQSNQEPFLDMLTRTSFPHPYTAGLERHRLLHRDFRVQASKEASSRRFTGVSYGIYKGERLRMSTRTRFTHHSP